MYNVAVIKNVQRKLVFLYCFTNMNIGIIVRRLSMKLSKQLLSKAVAILLYKSNMELPH